MHPAVFAAALVLAVASLMAGYLALRREKRELHWLLLALFLALMVWTLGTVLRFSVQTEDGLAVSLRVVFLGVFMAPPLWLLVSAHYARAPALLQRWRGRALLMLPSAVAYLAHLTNEAHGLVVREMTFRAMQGGGIAWAGPIFWAFLAWAHVCVIAGTALYVRSARRMVENEEERRQGLVMGLAALFPLGASSIYLFRILPVPFDLTPMALTLSLVCMSLAVFRYHLLESLPLARRDVIEHLRDGVVMASPSGVILDSNPAASRLLGRTPADLQGRPLQSILASLAGAESDSRPPTALEELRPGASPVVTELRTAGDRRIEVTFAWVRDSRGKPAGRYALLRDRTEERRSERLVRHAQKLRTVGTLASGIAHEVNNPLAFIRANLSEIHRMGERVAEACDADVAKLPAELADLPQIAEETLDGIERIERIVTGVSRLAVTREEPLRRLDVGVLLRDALRLSHLASSPDLTLEVRLEPDLPLVDGAPERLVQALLNLLVNARQALEGREGRIGVDVSSDGSWLEIRVSDDGPGIPEELHERIFDPFFTTRDPDQGTGLGLAIAYDILRDHDGSLDVHSRPGGGACFVARLPTP